LKVLKAAVVFIACTISGLLWWVHALESPFFNRETARSEKYLRQMYSRLAPDIQQERRLAQAYWLRYADVRENELWGADGVLGIKGPADHYRNHGRAEGRVFIEVARPDDMEREKVLAEAYWTRYPDVAATVVWGRKSSLGILGPRDHYQLFGKKEGRYWGE